MRFLLAAAACTLIACGGSTPAPQSTAPPSSTAILAAPSPSASSAEAAVDAGTAPAPPKRNVSARASVFDVYGAKDATARNELESELRARRRSFRECLESRRLEGQHDLIVRVVAHDDRRADGESIRFDPPSSHGQLSSIRIESKLMPESEPKAVRQCIREMLMAMTYPAPKSRQLPADPNQREAARIAEALTGESSESPSVRVLLRVVVETYEPGPVGVGIVRGH